MGNWLQRLEHTAEYLPGPWVVRWPSSTDAPVAFVGQGGSDPDYPHLIQVSPTDAGIELAGRRGAIWEDPVQEATARLISEAPDMIALLARVAANSEGDGAGPKGTPEPWGPLMDACRALLARHCRIGIGPPDALTAAARSDPPPPPPAPTLFDGWE